MNTTTTTRLFLSHASVDAAVAAQLCALLEARGVRCWIAPRDIPAGDEYHAALLNGIEACGGMVVLVTEASGASPFVCSEVERAFSKRKRLLHDHPRDGAIACADELQDRDLADLVHGQGVDDERNDRRADHCQDDQEHANLLC